MVAAHKSGVFVVSNPARAGGTPVEERLNAMRRWVAAPYKVDARLEVVGHTPVAFGLTVRVREANAWGLRCLSKERTSEGAAARVTLTAPNGKPLCATGSLASVRRAAGGDWEMHVVFDAEQPLLSAARIDAANFAA